MKQAYLKYIIALLLFGSNGIVASHIALHSYEIVLLRTLVGSLLLLILFFSTRQRVVALQKRCQLFYLVISGAAMGASWMFLYEAYQQLGVSIATLAYYCGPAIIMVLSPLLFHEALTWQKIAGFSSVLCGVLLVNGQVLSTGANAWGLFCGGLSAVMYAVMVVCNKQATNITGLENALLQLLMSFLTVAVFVGFRHGLFIEVSSRDWPAVLILGALNTGFGCYLYFSSLGHLPVQSVAVCGYLEPLSAVLFSVAFLHEAIQGVQILGAVLILGGAAFEEYGTVRKRKDTL